MSNILKKKRKNRKLMTLMVLIIAISVFPMRSSSANAGSSTKVSKVQTVVETSTKEKLDEAEKEKEEKEQELADAKSKLSATEATLSSIQSEKNTYQGKMNSLNEELQLVADKLAVIEANIDIKEIEIEETELLLEAATELRLQQYTNMKKRIQFMYERGDNMYLEVLLSAQSFGEFLNYADYVEQLSKYDREQLDEYIETEAYITETMTTLETEKAELEELEAEAVTEQSSVTGLIQETAEDIAETADKYDSVAKEVAAYESECDEKAKAAEEANAEYEAIKAQYEEEIRLSQLAAQSSWRDISEVSFDEGDRYLLANLIYCEAGGEPYAGKLAVGSVVINRLLSSRYPNTVTGVIYQNKQFSPVNDGHLASALANNKATAECYQAADEAMSGQTNVGNCVYFRTPIAGLTGTQIGNHIFY